MYTAAAGMAAQQLRLDSLADDLANVSTAGYKPARVAFRDLVQTPAARGAAPGISIGSGAAATLLGRTTRQGAITETGEPLDLALDGPGALEVRLPDGTTALSRDGRLHLDVQGRLVTSGGGQTGVTLPAGTRPEEVEIGADGSVRVGGRDAGRLRLQGTPRIVQRHVESSAVDVATTMSQLVETQRGYQLAAKAIEAADQMHQIANQLKR